MCLELRSNRRIVEGENLVLECAMICSFQIKRLRSEDPLEALVLRGSKRKLGDANDAWDPLGEQPHTFRLAKTYQSRQPGETLQETSETTDLGARKFCLPKRKRLRKNSADLNNVNDETMAGLHNMVEGYMNSQKDEPRASDAEADKETEDYVYDVYFNSQTKPPKNSRIGYIDLDEDEEKLLFECSDSDEAYRAAEGDEDSNAESFYLNDYPDEDQFGSSSDDKSDTECLSQDGLHIDAWSEESEDETSARYERYGW